MISFTIYTHNHGLQDELDMPFINVNELNIPNYNFQYVEKKNKGKLLFTPLKYSPIFTFASKV
jgi:hypothetical protein